MQATFGEDQPTPENVEDSKPDEDQRSDILTVSQGGTTAGEDGKEDPLVQFELDMSQLKDYLNTITKVVNQHAKLLDDVSKELAVRPVKTEIG